MPSLSNSIADGIIINKIYIDNHQQKYPIKRLAICSIEYGNTNDLTIKHYTSH